jgi:hypothetical protein
VSAFEENPGTYERWANVLEENEQAQVGEYGRGALMISDGAKVQWSMEDRFGQLTDSLLNVKSLVVDTGSRERVIKEVGKALSQRHHSLKSLPMVITPLTIAQTASLLSRSRKRRSLPH